MRSALGLFGLAAGAVVVALVGRYGYANSDTPVDGVIAAFFYATIALGGIAGPAVAVRVFKAQPGWGLLLGLVSLVALLANLTNSLGAIAGRGDKLAATRAQAANAQRDDRAELARLTREREAVGTFTPATADGVAAARLAVAAAERTTQAECASRGKNCRQREADEAARRSELATVLANKAATDRAATLDAGLADVRARLAASPPVAAVNPLADALGRVFNIKAATAGTAQQIAMVTVVELLIALALIAAEVLPSGKRQQVPKNGPPARASFEVAHPPVVRQERSPASNFAGRQQVSTLPAPVEAASDQALPDIARWAVAALAPAEGASVRVAGLHRHYVRWCSGNGLQPAPAGTFRALFLAMCASSGFHTGGGKVSGLTRT